MEKKKILKNALKVVLIVLAIVLVILIIHTIRNYLIITNLQDKTTIGTKCWFHFLIELRRKKM